MNVRLGLALAAVVVTACGGSAPIVPSSPNPTPSGSNVPPSATPKDDGANKTAAIEKLTTDESKTGKCDADHEAALGRLLDAVETSMKTKSDDDGKPVNLQLVQKKVLALGSSARGVELSVTGKGTELHVMAFGAKEISMDVLAGTTAATTLRSPHARGIPNLAIDLHGIGKITEIQTDSRQVVIKPGQPLQVKLTGQGCAGMIAFLKAG